MRAPHVPAAHVGHFKPTNKHNAVGSEALQLGRTNIQGELDVGAGHYCGLRRVCAAAREVSEATGRPSLQNASLLLALLDLSRVRALRSLDGIVVTAK